MYPFDPDMENESMSKKPIHEVRLGRIKAAIWENDTQNGTLHNVTLSRLYKDGDPTSFGRDDLPLVAKVADLCHTWIFQQKREDNGNGNGGGKENGGKEDF